jgi:multidrug efflux pump subunit AcrA (membrane-fusion protein)
MRTRITVGKPMNWKSVAFAVAASALVISLSGCKSAEKEKEPEVSVQTTPAQRAPISETISAEAVVFPLEQATVAPKITSTIKRFLVQRGTHVKN